MEIKSDYSVTRLFVTKEIRITADKQEFILKVKTIKDFYVDRDWNAAFHIWTAPVSQLSTSLGLKNKTLTDSYDLLNLILFDLGQYGEFRKIYTLFNKVLEDILPQIKIEPHNITINDITMTREIWEYVLYILKLTSGEKVEKPLSFSSEEARKFYLAQKEAEEKIKAIKSQKEADSDNIMKLLLSITYSFPSFTVDYLFDQTMAQIQWLQKHAAGAVSYEVNAKAFAAGNVKKGKKLDFFIK